MADGLGRWPMAKGKAEREREKEECKMRRFHLHFISYKSSILNEMMPSVHQNSSFHLHHTPPIQPPYSPILIPLHLTPLLFMYGTIYK